MEPFYRRRPGWLEDQIDASYACENAANILDLAFGRHQGLDPVYEFAGTTTDEIAALLRARNGGGIRVLDVGTGMGGLVTHHLAQGDYAQGVTALDYLRLNDRHPLHGSPSYIIANAERLSSVAALVPQYDMVMTRATLHHFIDPLGSFVQMARRVAPSGILCADAFAFGGVDCEVTREHVCNAMRTAGFEQLRVGEMPDLISQAAMPEAIWQRTTNMVFSVRLPVEYALQNGKLAYVLSPTAVA
ncbi:MAG TPA: class I SAM-dependent methyltransferase [Candidatus Saccharimonadales bacterium]|jgi:SAM-dependent methyltransferase